MRKKHPHVPERFLRQIWKHKQFNTEHLKTTDGRELEIISPGLLNKDGGPDFAEACVRIDGILYRGHVELHQRDEEWSEHTHDTDEKYNSVILHVVLYEPATGNKPLTKSLRPVPVLALAPYLAQSFRSTWEAMILNERAERLSSIKCYSHNDGIGETTLRAWLRHLAVERMELKMRKLEDRLKELSDEQQLHVAEPVREYDDVPFGIHPDELPPPVAAHTAADFRNSSLWNQLLYEGVMEALGYTKNQKPFLLLARSAQLHHFAKFPFTVPPESVVRHIEAILFTTAGLLPDKSEIRDEETIAYMKMLETCRSEHQQYYSRHVLTTAQWQFFRLRPENFPTIRIAGAARLIFRFLERNMVKTIVQLMKNRDIDQSLKRTLLEELFIVTADGYWKHHFLFGEQSATTNNHLIGEGRTEEIIINVVLPVCFLYARIFKDKDVRNGTLKVFEARPPLGSNTITRTMDQQLIKKKFRLDSAMLQQGTIELYKYYCLDERCDECAVGKIVFDE